MSVDRVSTAAQTQYFLTQIQQAGSALDKTQAADRQHQGLQHLCRLRRQDPGADRFDRRQCAQHRLSDRHLARRHPGRPCRTPSSPACPSLAAQLRKAVSDAVGNNDGSTLMTQAQSIFDQAAIAILNSKDANGDYIYSGGKTDVPPVTVNSLSALAALPSVSDAFANGTDKKSVQVADGVTVSYGVTASDAATGLMQALVRPRPISTPGPTGNLSASTQPHRGAVQRIWTGAIASTSAMSNNLTTVVAQNGYVYNRLTDAQSQQTSMDTLYKGFISNLQDTNMATAATQLSLNQTQLQAALGVTAQLNQLSLLNYLPVS